MKKINFFKPRALVLSAALLTCIFAQSVQAAPKVILTSVQCTGGFFNHRTLKVTIQSNIPGAGYLYWKKAGCSTCVWNTNGIPANATSGLFSVPKFSYPIEVILACGSTSSSLGTYGSGADGNNIVVQPCAATTIERAHERERMRKK